MVNAVICLIDIALVCVCDGVMPAASRDGWSIESELSSNDGFTCVCGDGIHFSIILYANLLFITSCANQS